MSPPNPLKTLPFEEKRFSKHLPPPRVRVLDGGVEIRAGSDAAGYKELKVLPSRVEMKGNLNVEGNITTSGTNTGDLTAQRGTFGKQVTVQRKDSTLLAARIFTALWTWTKTRLFRASWLSRTI